LPRSTKNGDPVSGAHLKLYDFSFEDPREISLPDQGITGAEPWIIEQLAAGHTYQLEEISSPKGYHASKAVTFTIPSTASNEQTITVSMTDQTAHVSVLKMDDAGTPVTGAHLAILETRSTKKETSPQPGMKTGRITVVDFITEGTVYGTDISSYVQGGSTYILRELEAPLGYRMAQDVVFTVTGTADVTQSVLMSDVREKRK